MAKTVLTKKNCLKDIDQPQWIIWVLAYLCTWLPRFCVAFVAKIASDVLGEVPFLVLYAIAWLIGIGWAVKCLIRGYKLRRLIRKNMVFIVEEKLIGKDFIEDANARLRRHYTGDGPEITTTLVFPSYGEYKAYTQGSGTSHYLWSEEQKTGARGLYFDAEIGDTYYLVVTKDKTEKLLEIYNTKRFTLAEEDFEKRGERYYFK